MVLIRSSKYSTGNRVVVPSHADGVKMGYLPQEPQLDASKNVRENVMDAVAAK